MQYKAYKYIVRGSGSFPIDLLRRELCWPSTVHDALHLASRANVPVPNSCNYTRTISLTGIKMPSTVLWRNAGYYVIKVESIQLSREILEGV